ncbi:MAG: ATP-binding protein [Bacteroidota bacterium]
MLEALKDVISQTYEEADKERRKKDRSVELMSSELMELTRKNQEKSEAYIQAIMENVVDGIIMLNGNHEITSFNPVAENMFGHQVEQVLGKTPGFLLEESFQDDFVELLDHSLIEGGYVSSDGGKEFLGKNIEGKEFPLEFSISVINLEDESFLLLIMKDISERKRIERELILAKETAIESAKAKAQFLSNMSHEIRTPMNAVLGLTEMLMEEDPRQDQLDTLKILKFSGDNLLVIINDILDFSKIEAGKIDLETIDIDLKDLTTSIQTSLVGKATEKGIKLEIQKDPKIPAFIKGDPVRLSQVLTNLVSNAVKFTSQGGVTLEMLHQGESPKTIQIQFNVIDTGIGIPEDKLELIFESFTQSNSNTTRKFGGTGLGLAISKRLVELFGGQIKVESKIGVGTTFSFALTFAKSLKDESQNHRSHKQSITSLTGLEGAKILLVEDNKVNQIVASKFLKKWKIAFDIADNGLIAVEMVQKKEYELVLMDLHMPELDGYQATIRIRALEDPTYSSLPIIALTASALIQIKQEVLDAGMNDFVSKPFKAKELYQTMLDNIRRLSPKA